MAIAITIWSLISSTLLWSREETKQLDTGKQGRDRGPWTGGRARMTNEEPQERERRNGAKGAVVGAWCKQSVACTWKVLCADQ